MGDPYDSFDEDDGLALAFIQQEQQTVGTTSTTHHPNGASKLSRTPPEKRERKRSRGVSPTFDDGRGVRNMKPRVQRSTAVEVEKPSEKSGTDPVSLAVKEEIDLVNDNEDVVVWPPLQTFAAEALRRHGSTSRSSSESKPHVKCEEPITVKGSKGKSKATSVRIDIKRDAAGNVTENAKQAIKNHLLNTLGEKNNPITNSDLYTRTAHVISCATGHQVAQRAGSKFSISEKTYFHSRNAKLRQQFTAQAREGLRVAEGTEAGAGVGIGGRFGAELSRMKAEGGDAVAGGGMMIQPSRIFAGLTFYINGYTGPRISDLVLKRLIAVHGGNVSYLANSSCTHILITKNLSASKTQKFLDSASSVRGGKRKVVHVDWVLDSVAKCRRLDETPYNVIVNKAQPTLVSSLGVVKQRMTRDTKTGAGGKGSPVTASASRVEVISIDD